ncbi:prenyltransferase/squalene oxidase repeat-containing protein [Eubacterium sp.]|uniref:InlB B-repeat-containing protein n=1 Tax=Eubacterium sp. TaxID=142586 RepID=UPI0025D83F22|nr:prenyltransferase/squalene oxidase repeat-containing protein [Eubacterium sp.]MCR5629479.1 VWA domain-containing protein [Eubacterium sp.]
MSKLTLRFIAITIAVVMCIEVALLRIENKVYSDEIISSTEIKNSLDKANKWIRDNQDKDGSFKIGMEIYDEEIVSYYLSSVKESKEIVDKSLNYLNTIEARNNDDLFRMNLAKYMNNKSAANIDFEKLQNYDGGFSIFDGYESDTLDTILALENLYLSDDYALQTIEKALMYIKKKQNSNGSFSYNNEEESIFLTAYVYKVLKDNLELSDGNTYKGIVDKAYDYLLKKENTKNAWELDKESIKNSLICTSALLNNDDNSRNRIKEIKEKLASDGSLYEDVELTAMYISLVNDYLQMVNGKDVDSYIKNIVLATEDGKIKAYTDILFKPVVVGLKEGMSISAVLYDEDGKSEVLENKENTFVYNTKNHLGKCHILVILIDENGEVISSKIKNFNIGEYFEISSLNVEVTPKAYKLGSKRKIEITPKAYVLANVDRKTSAYISVEDKDGNIIYSDEKELTCGKGDRSVSYDTSAFVPEVNEKGLLKVNVVIKEGNKSLINKSTYVKMFETEDENRIDIDYKTSEDFIEEDTKSVDVDFNLSGKGLSENIKRRPMDIIIILDDSGSMDGKDWNEAIDGAINIVSKMQPQDRVEFRFITKVRKEHNFSNDKEEVIKWIESKRNFFLWGGTPIYRNLNWCVEDFEDEERDKVIYLFSDGLRSGDDKVLNEEGLKEKNVTIYSVLLESNVEARNLPKAIADMTYFADLTGGRFIGVENREDITKCVDDLVGDIFKMAGRDITVSMTLGKDIPYENIIFENEPDEVVDNEDGTKRVKFLKDYISVGEDFGFKISFDGLDEVEKAESINIIKDIKLEYLNENDERVERILDDIDLECVKKNRKVDTEESEESILDEDVIKLSEDDKNLLSHNKEIDDDEENIKLSGSVDFIDEKYFVDENIKAKIKMSLEGNKDIQNIDSSIILVNVNDENVKRETDKNISIDGNKTTSTDVEVNTNKLGEGDYIAVLVAKIDGTYQALDVANINLEEKRYNLYVETKKGGSVSIKNGLYKAGELIKIKAVADDDYVFDRWECEEGVLDNSQIYKSEIEIVMPKSDVTIKVIFAKKTNIDQTVKKKNNSSNELAENNSNNDHRTDEKIINNNSKNKKSVKKDVVKDGHRNSINKKNDKHKTVNKNYDEENDDDSKYQNDTNDSSPRTGDYMNKDLIRILLLIQSMSLIMVCLLLKKKEKDCKNAK